jgi:hypothetical protein
MIGTGIAIPFLTRKLRQVQPLSNELKSFSSTSFDVMSFDDSFTEASIEKISNEDIVIEVKKFSNTKKWWQWIVNMYLKTIEYIKK